MKNKPPCGVVKYVQYFTRQHGLMKLGRHEAANRLRALRAALGLHGQKFKLSNGLPWSKQQQLAFDGVHIGWEPRTNGTGTRTWFCKHYETGQYYRGPKGNIAKYTRDGAYRKAAQLNQKTTN